VLPQIQAFLEVARRGNLSRAAEALYVSQPTLTARLQALESELGEQLFVRTRRGMRLTEAGEAFLPFAEHSVQAISDGRDRLSELRRGTLGKLLLGAPPTVSTYALPTLLARFTAEHPGVRLTVMTGTSEEILELVLHDRVQVGLMVDSGGRDERGSGVGGRRHPGGRGYACSSRSPVRTRRDRSLPSANHRADW